MIVIKVNYTTDQPIIKVNYDDAPIYISTTVDATYIKVDYGTGGGGGGGAIWGDIIGTLSDQLDLQAALDAKVPYTGATANVDLGEYELKAGQIELDQSPTGTAGVAVTRWNDTIGSTETTLKGGNVILKNGVDLIARVVNKVTPNTTLTKAAYQAVKVSGAQGQRLAVALAQANNDNNSADTLGLVTETIPTNQEGFIMTVGNLEGINTTGSLQGETWSDGDVLYLSPTTAGAITNIKPNGSTGHIVVIGYVEYAHQNNGKIYVKIMNGWELDELHNVFISSPANNDALIYESATSLWKNKSIATALGYTPVPSTRSLTINGTSYDLSADRTWSVGTVTSVALTVPTGLVVTSGSPITTSGTIAVGLQSGYSIPTTVKQGNWDDAYTFVSNFPSQTGNSGKYLTTDGNTLSWGTVSTANIYNSDGTLTGDRTITANGKLLALIGGKDLGFSEERSMLIQSSNTTRATVGIAINNTATNGKIWELRSCSDATFRIYNATSTAQRFVLSDISLLTPALIYGNGNSFNLGYDTGLLFSGLWFGATSAASVNISGNSTQTTINANGDIYFTKGLYTNTGRIFGTTGNWRIQTGGTFADDGYKLDVQGTGRFNAASSGTTSYSLEVKDTNSSIGANLLLKFSTQTGYIFSNRANGLRILTDTGTTLLSFRNAGTTYIGATESDTPPTKLGVAVNSQTTANDGLTIVDNTQSSTSQSTIGFYATGTGGFGNKYIARIGSYVGSLFNQGGLTFNVDNGAGTLNELMRMVYTGNILVNTTTDIASSIFTIASTTKGFLQPRMTTTQRDAISTPATGLSVYNTTTNTSDFYNGTSWVSLASGNIYTADGTLSGNRTVTMGSNTLSFSGDLFINGLTVGKGNGSLNNTAFGVDTIASTTSGFGNSAFGSNSSRFLTTGLYNSTFGLESLRSSTAGTGNSAFGYASLYSSQGNRNTSVGSASFYSLSSGNDNTSIGNNSGRYLTDGVTGNTTCNTSIFIGSETKALANNQSNQIVIGYGSVGLGSNTTVIGNSSTTDTAIYGRMLVNYGTPVIGTYALDVNGTGRFTGQVTCRTLSNSTGATDYSIELNGISTTDATTRILINCGTLSSTGVGFGARIINATVSNFGVGTFITSNGNSAIGYVANTSSNSLAIPGFAARSNGQSAGGSIGYIWMNGNTQSFFHSIMHDEQLRLYNPTGIIYSILDRTKTNITFGSSTYYASAQLAIDSTTSGFLPPRMTETQKNAISTPATGLIVYQTDGTEGLYERTSTAWRLINASGSGGGITRSVNNISTTTTAGSAASTDYVYLISGTTTLTLPTAAGNTNRYTLKNVGTGTVTINTTSSQTIDGSTSITMAVQYTALDVISDGTNWNII